MIIDSPLRALEKLETRSHRIETLTEPERKILDSKLKAYQSSRSNLEEFKDIYSPSQIEEDKEYVTKLERQFAAVAKDSDFYGQLLEMLTVKLGGNWLPAKFSPSFKYDDYKNGVDVFVEIPVIGKTVLRIGLDFTSDERKVKEKMLSTREKYEKGKFQEVKYFKSKLDNNRGKNEVPKIIAGTDRDNIINLAKLFISYDNTTNDKEKARYKEKIDNHVYAQDLIQLIVEQIDRAVDLLKLPFPTTEIYMKILELEELKKIIEEFKNKKAPKGASDQVGISSRIAEAIRETYPISK